MKRTFAAIAGALVAVIAVAPAASAEPTVPSPTVIASAPPAHLPPVAPTVDLFPLDQFEFLGYKVSKKAIEAKPTSKDRSEINRFQSKFGLKQTGKADKATLKALNKYAGDAEVPERCKTGKWTLCVNKFNRTVMAVTKDGQVAKTIDARFGMPGHFTREGSFKVFRKGGYDHMSTLYKVNMPYPMFFSGGQAIHFSWEFSRYPNTQSHGCVGTRDLKAQKWLWDRSPIGTPVIVFDKAPAQP